MANICNFSIQEPEAGDFEFFETSMGQSELQATCNYLARLCLKKTKTETKNSKYKNPEKNHIEITQVQNKNLNEIITPVTQ